MPVAEHKTENKLSTRDSTPLKPLVAVGHVLIPKGPVPGVCKCNCNCIPAQKTIGRGEERGSKEGGEQNPAAPWLAEDQLSSSDLLFVLQEELEAVENIGVSPRLAREPCFMGCIQLAPGDGYLCCC